MILCKLGNMHLCTCTILQPTLMGFMIKKKILPNFETCKTSFNFDICHVSPIFTNTSMFHILTIRNSKFPTPWTILWSFDVSWYIVFEPLAMFYHVLSASCVWNPCIFILLFKGISKIRVTTRNVTCPISWKGSNLEPNCHHIILYF